MEKQIKTNNSIGLAVFFLLVILGFTGYNVYECVFDLESCGQKKGFAQMETLKQDGVTLWGGVQRILGIRQVLGENAYNDVTLLDNGYATLADPEAGIQAAQKGAMQGYQLAQELGADFLYVQVPHKQLAEEEMPLGVQGYSVEKYRNMVKWLAQEEIPHLGMEEILLAEDEDWLDYYYKSDHHWKNNAAFLCYEEVVSYMKSKGIPVIEEYCEEDAFYKKNYENVFLGTHGRMVGPLYTGVDDYELWLPAFETDYTWFLPDYNVTNEGNFEDCFVFEEYLQEYSYDYYAYYSYFQQDFDLMEITNNKNADGAHVVLIKDSQAVPVAAFLMNQCSELDIIDLRYPSNNDYVEYIKEKNPDIILYIFGTGYLHDEVAMVMQ